MDDAAAHDDLSRRSAPGPDGVPVPNRPLDDAYRVETLAESTTITRDDVLELWRSHGVVAEAQTEQRLDEVLHVGVHEIDGLVAVSTVYLQRNEQLRADMWHFRTYTTPDHRTGNLAARLALATWDHLCEQHASGADTRAPGAILEIENEGLRRHRPEAVWQPGQLFFIGEKRNGAHVRVRYFPGATVPTPAP